MSTPDHDHLTAHDYDGIQEYDNPLPGWWKWLFVLSIVFSCGYTMYYHLGGAPTVEEKYYTSLQAHLDDMLAPLGAIRRDNETILRLMTNEKLMGAVGGMFKGNCAQCHGADGSGNVGPNLTDDVYKNIQSPLGIYNVIANGIPTTSMAGWEQRLREEQMILLASYVAHLRGQNLSGQPPEGDPAPPWSSFQTQPSAPDTSTDE